MGTIHDDIPIILGATILGAFCNLQKKNETKQNENPKFPKLKFAIYETEIFYFAKRESLRLFHQSRFDGILARENSHEFTRGIVF